MKTQVYPDRSILSKAAADDAASILRETISQKGRARLIAATGASQIEFLEALIASPGIDWSKVELFHLDEYIGLSAEHPASFRKYLLERLIGPAGISKHYLLDGEQDPQRVCREIGDLLAQDEVDVAFAGIGENGHLAFNDPPADFETEEPYIVVELDEACRRQQVGEGWFSGIDEVPTRAISMSIRQILKAKNIICVVPDARKAEAIRLCFTGAISPMAPASILRTHEAATVYLDSGSASLMPLAGQA